MPNYCDCELAIYCDEVAETKRIYDAITTIEDGKVNFDFNKLIQYPKLYDDLDILAEKARRAGTRMVDGYNSGGYEWCRENWGTKWNALECKATYHGEEELIIKFRTAWSPPLPVIDKLAEMFMKASITFEWYERGMAFCGSASYNAGKRTDFAESKYYGHRGG